MYKNQLQELAQRSCFNLPSYSCFRQGPDHAPRFRASVNFNGEIFQSPSYCTTLRQAEHSAAEVALNTLSIRGPSRSLTAKVIDETGVYKNLIQETAHRAGLNLPVYTTIRSGPGHLPVFTCTVELASMSFTGEGGKTKKQAEKNAAFTAWSTLKQMTNKETESNEEQEQVLVARVLSKFNPKDETKEGKQRNQNQARKRLMVPGYRDSTSIRFGPSCQNSNSPVLYQQRRSMELLSDFYPSRNRNEQKSKFLAPLPSPPCPPNRTISVEVKTKSQVNSQEIRTPLDEHRKDEEEWLYGKAFVTEKSIEKESDKANSDSGFNTNKPTTNHQFPIVFPPFIYNPMPDQNPTQQTKIRTSCYQPHRRINGGGFLSQNMAPAVQVRSVIPVCATPPMVVDSSSSSENLPKQLTQLKEASPTSIPTTVSISTEQKTIVASSLKMNNLQL